MLWTAGFVLLTLVINASMLPWLLRITRLSTGAGADARLGCRVFGWIWLGETS